MSDEPRRKKKSEKLSDSLMARLARDDPPSHRSNPETRARTEGAGPPPGLASMGAAQSHKFTRCPHCREYVPIRDTCRACGTPMG